jgi:hypothetical protein
LALFQMLFLKFRKKLLLLLLLLLMRLKLFKPDLPSRHLLNSRGILS